MLVGLVWTRGMPQRLQSSSYSPPLCVENDCCVISMRADGAAVCRDDLLLDPCKDPGALVTMLAAPQAER